MPDPSTRPRSVRVDAPARLHLGVLDLRRGEGRWFGGLGVAVARPRVRVVARPAGELEVSGALSGLVRKLASRQLARLPGAAGAAIRVEEAVPRHVGLGSGTQLALAVGRALDLLHGRERPADELALALGRGDRSAVGTWLFDRGGFVLEGGRRRDREAVAPLLCRFGLPESWRAVLVRPPAPGGLSGEREADAFDRLPAPDDRIAERVAHLVLMELLPAVATGDLEAFGRAAEEVERATGEAFSPAQGGRRFAHARVARAVELLREAGAVGVGQSSWGPTAYGFVEDGDAARRAAEALRDERPGWDVRSVRLENRGWRQRTEIEG